MAEILGKIEMRRTGDLWDKIISYDNLFAAAKAAAAGKRHRADVARFGLDLENEIVRLRSELDRDAYVPGPYRCFEVREPKRRLISAAPFRDRVVHHALTRVIEPVFERRFTANSYACRKGRGTHRALEAASKGCATYRYVLKCDVRKYFPSIDHLILRDLLCRVLKCPRSLALAGKIIDGSNAQEPVAFYFAGDDLFTPHERRKGLPLGNQTSQFFANVYLNPLDHFVTRRLRPGRYVRYVDDFLFFGNSRQELAGRRLSIETFLESLRLKIHARKSRVYRTTEGVTFLGWRIFPDRMRLVRQNVVRFRRRLRWLREQYAAGEIEWDEVDPRVRA